MSICKTAADFGAVIDRFMRDEVEPLVAEAAKAGAMAVYRHVTTAATTWSSEGPVWTGRFRWSTNVSIGAPNGGSLPEHPERPEWPKPPSSPYSVEDVLSGTEVLTNVQPFQVIYISNGVPYAGDVEAHTQIFALSAELARAELKGMSFKGMISPASSDIPF